MNQAIIDRSDIVDITAPRLRVLLVEPDAAAALRLRSDLVTAGVEVGITHVSSALAALRALQRERFDCVLLELDLPDASGLAACDAFLTHPTQLPVVVLSAYDLTDESAEALAHESVRRGVQDWLDKRTVAAADVVRSIEFAVARRSNELHLRTVRERLLGLEAEVDARRLSPTATTAERLAFAIDELHEAVEAAAMVVDDVRQRLAR